MTNKGKYYESQFEEATIELLREAHWQYAFGDDIHRKYTDPLIEEDLRNFLAVQYKDKNLTTSEMDSIILTCAIQADRMTIMLFGMLFCSIVTGMILHIAMVGIIRFVWNTLTSGIQTIIFSVVSISLLWNRDVKIAVPTYCFS